MPTVKWIFQLNQVKADELQKLLDETGADSVDFMNVAFTMVKWAIKHVKKGHTIAAVDETEKKYYELQMEFLDCFKPAEAELSQQDQSPDHTE